MCKQVAESMQDQFASAHPALVTVVQLGHTVSSSKTWTSSWNALRRTTPALANWGTAFRYLTKDAEHPSESLTLRLLEKSGPKLTSVVLGSPATVHGLNPNAV
jgi:hypothetical protein